MNKDFFRGLRHGFPICLGYFSVSFGIGIMAVKAGLSAGIATLVSLTNLTSAGEAAGIGVIAGAGSFIEMILTQLLINCRYSLMGLSLSQKLSPSFTRGKRLIASFGITDEIFGVCYAQKEPITPPYMFGMILISTFGWTLGTFLGAFCGEILPGRLSAALGIMLYGMFIAIIVPPARKSRSVLLAVLLAATVSCILSYFFPQISAGFSVVISAVLAAVIMAIVRPVKDEAETEAET